MVSGKQKRLRRIFREDGKTVIIPMDHGVTDGPILGLVDMQSIVQKLIVGGADAVVLHKGIARNVDTGKLGLIIHASASTRFGPDSSRKVRVCNIEEAIRLGCDAVSMHVNIGAAQEPEMLMKLSAITDECDLWGIPSLAMIYPRGPSIKSEHDPEAVAHAARLGAELGADIVKTNYTGDIDSFRRVVQGCPVPVVIAGGPRIATVENMLRMIHDAIEAGCAGVSIGRNVFQSTDPTAVTKAIVDTVHEGASVNESLRILGERS
jgi:fructose-bisphosphate aldolase/2-amino-3,7-dideoxy-D-threo-hept-6-ulosonate synthase